MAPPVATLERRLAHRVLIRVYEDEAYADRALSGILDKLTPPPQPRERAFTTELVYGVLRNNRHIDFLIREFSSRRIAKIQIDVLIALRIAVYEILHMRTPTHSAVDQAIKLLVRKGKPLRGFANGLLREFSRQIEQDNLPDASARSESPLQAIAIANSIPDEILQTVNEMRSIEETQAWAEINRLPGPFTIRVNPRKNTREQLAQVLGEVGIESSPHPTVPFALDLTHPGNISQLESFQNGLFSVQDVASQLVCHLVDPKPTDRIIDLCAAPGGKSTFLAELTDDKAQILACDLHPGRVRLIETGRDRLQLNGITAAQIDATDSTQLRALVDNWGDGTPASKVLLDAPCSGFGTLRRNPDLRLRLPDPQKLAEIQLKLLNSADLLLERDGILIYSVCTFTPLESTEVIAKFLELHPNYQVLPPPESCPTELRTSCPSLFEGEFFRSWTDLHQCDGFFGIKLKKLS